MSRSKVRSAPAWYSGLVVSVMPCSGMSIAATTNPCGRRRPQWRQPVCGCPAGRWNITTGQPVPGFACPLAVQHRHEKRMPSVAFATGTGLNRVRFVDGTPPGGPPGAASQWPVSGAAGSR